MYVFYHAENKVYQSLLNLVISIRLEIFKQWKRRSSLSFIYLQHFSRLLWPRLLWVVLWWDVIFVVW